MLTNCLYASAKRLGYPEACPGSMCVKNDGKSHVSSDAVVRFLNEYRRHAESVQSMSICLSPNALVD